MKKTAIIFTLAIFLTFLAFAEKFDGLSFLSYDFKDIRFSNGNMIFYSCDPFGISENSTYKYKTYNKNNLTFIEVSNGVDKKDFLALVSENILVLHDENPEPYFFGQAGKCELYYFAEPFSMYDYPDGIKNNVICKTIESSVNASYLFFCSGYVSFENPHLWGDYSRPKEILVYFLDKKDDKKLLIKLDDTPNPQMIDFKCHYEGKLKIEILSVYEGRKYKDPCIHSIITKAY